MARLGGAASSAAPTSAGDVSERDEDGRELYEVLADQVAGMSVTQRLALGAALQRGDWSEIAEEHREVFRVAAEEFLSEGGA